MKKEEFNPYPDICIRCGITRDYYDLKHEPSVCHPDCKMGECAEGHIWARRTPYTILHSSQVHRSRQEGVGMTEKEKLVKELLTKLCNKYSSDDIQFITELVIADRNLALEEVEKALKHKYPPAGEGCECNAYGECECACGASWKEPKECQRDFALQTIAKLKGE